MKKVSQTNSSYTYQQETSRRLLLQYFVVSLKNNVKDLIKKQELHLDTDGSPT